MEYLPYRRYAYATSFESLEPNQPFKEENSLVALGWIEDWDLARNPRAASLEASVELPTNAVRAGTMVDAILAAYQGGV